MTACHAKTIALYAVMPACVISAKILSTSTLLIVWTRVQAAIMASALETLIGLASNVRILVVQPYIQSATLMGIVSLLIAKEVAFNGKRHRLPRLIQEANTIISAATMVPEALAV
jgi:hypothetical protein